jgi:hypothetical protein
VASTVTDAEKRKLLCGAKGEEGGCEKADGSVWPPTILFLANFVAGMGGSLYYTLGVSYMDDNIQKAKTPALISEYQPAPQGTDITWCNTLCSRVRVQLLPTFFLASSETSVLTIATLLHIPEDGTFHSHRRENLKSYIALTG